MSHPDVLAQIDGLQLGPGLCCGWPRPDPSALRAAHELVPELMIKRAISEFPKIPFQAYIYQPEPSVRVLALFGPDSPPEFELRYSTKIRTHADIDELARSFYRFIMSAGQSLTPLERV